MGGLKVGVLVLAGAAVACTGSAVGRGTYVSGFTKKAPAVTCREVSPFQDVVDVEDVSPAGDTAVLVLDGTARMVRLLGTDLKERWSFAFDDVGPRGIKGPSSAVVVGDSIVYIADRDARLLKRFTPDGREHGAVPLPFTPLRVRALRGALLVTALVMGRLPGYVLFRVEGDDVTPLPVTPVPFADMSIKALGNMMALATRSDGGWLAAHRFLAPSAFRASPGGTPHAVAIPLPSGTRRLVTHVPAPPITDEVASRVAVIALSLAVDNGTGDVIYLTRSGQLLNGRNEKALIRADSTFHFRAAERLPVTAVDFALLPGGREALVVDDDLRWSVCPVP